MDSVYVYDKFNRKISKLFRKISDCYSERGEILRDISILCIRLVFCMYSDRVGIFKNRAFWRLIDTVSISQLSVELQSLFKALNTPIKKRIDYKFDGFPYINELFDVEVSIPKFSVEVYEYIRKLTYSTNWSLLTPLIFCSLYESTLSSFVRSDGGVHYTSIENIHKVIDSLFLNDLKKEFSEITIIENKDEKKSKLKSFLAKLYDIVVLDPSSGCGNFLIESYLSLRKLENECLRELEGLPSFRIGVGQFIGIEIDSFSVSVSKVSLWIAELLTNIETEKILGIDLKFEPFNSKINIQCKNALVDDNGFPQNWNTIVDKSRVRYIIGNPPFYGGMKMNGEQKKELRSLFGEVRGVGEFDYVTGWYKLALDYIRGTKIKVAFVSTNSLCMGQSATTFWKYLIDNGIKLNFAFRSFKWKSNSLGSASVTCIIVGFACYDVFPKYIIEENGEKREVERINQYLHSDDIGIIESRNYPICSGVPKMIYGNMARDGGALSFGYDEKERLIRENPVCEVWIKPYVGGKELIYGKERWCLWLFGADREKIKECPGVMDHIRACKRFRASSKANDTQRLVSKPELFSQVSYTNSRCLLVPRTSSNKREYIPMGFIGKNVIANDSCFVIPNATMYHFGVLTSDVHMAWMRYVCGRRNSDFRYSKDVVYNNFVWPEVDEEGKSEIEETARVIIDVRKKYNRSLADLYNLDTMPMDLKKAHKNNNNAVRKAYGFNADLTDNLIVKNLIRSQF